MESGAFVLTRDINSPVKCAGSQQFCFLQSIISCFLHNGVPQKPICSCLNGYWYYFHMTVLCYHLYNIYTMMKMYFQASEAIHHFIATALFHVV